MLKSALGQRRSRPISRVLSWAIIPLGRPSPVASSSLPGSHARTRRCRLPCDFPIWPCSRWGFPCHVRYRPRGALLPHHFTLTCVAFPDGELAHRRYLSVALSVGSRLPGVTWHRVRRSPDFPPHFARNAAIAWPTPRRTIPVDGPNNNQDFLSDRGRGAASAAIARAAPRARKPRRAALRKPRQQAPQPWKPASARGRPAA